MNNDLVEVQDAAFVAMIDDDIAGHWGYGGAALSALPTATKVAIIERLREFAHFLKSFQDAVKSSIEADMVAQHATRFPHPELDIKYKPKKLEPIVDGKLLYNGLQSLSAQGKIPQELADKCCWFEDVREWHTHATQLGVARAYGDDVAKVIDAHYLPNEGPPELKITAKKR